MTYISLGTGIADIHTKTDSIVFGGSQSCVVLNRNTSGYHGYSLKHCLNGKCVVKATTWVKQVPYIYTFLGRVSQLTFQTDTEVVVVGYGDGGVVIWDVEPNTTTSVCKHDGAIIYLSASYRDGV